MSDGSRLIQSGAGYPRGATRSHELFGRIGGASIDHQMLDLMPVLCLDTVEALGQVALRIQRRSDDRDQQARHCSALTRGDARQHRRRWSRKLVNHDCSESIQWLYR